MPGSCTPACGALPFTIGRASEQPMVNASTASRRHMSFHQGLDEGDQRVDLIRTQLVLESIHFLLLAVLLLLDALEDDLPDLVVGEILRRRQILHAHLLPLIGLRLAVIAVAGRALGF